MRTDEEILARLEARKDDDMFGFEWHEYLVRLPASAAKPYLKPDADANDWTAAPRDQNSLLRQMLEYMPFAWEKANNNRGISAWRSVAHYVAWTWIAGDEKLAGEIARMLEHDYCYYGKPILVHLCKAYGWNWRQWDDDRWTNDEESEGVTADQALDAA